MTTTQTKSRLEIEEHIRVREQTKSDLFHRLETAESKEARDYLKEKIREINTELRIFTKIHAAFTKTIKQRR